jgi:hypothetical protein
MERSGANEKERSGLAERERQDKEIAKVNRTRQIRQGHVSKKSRKKKAPAEEAPKSESK